MRNVNNISIKDMIIQPLMILAFGHMFYVLWLLFEGVPKITIQWWSPIGIAIISLGLLLLIESIQYLVKIVSVVLSLFLALKIFHLVFFYAIGIRYVSAQLDITVGEWDLTIDSLLLIGLIYCRFFVVPRLENKYQLSKLMKRTYRIYRLKANSFLMKPLSSLRSKNNL